MIGRKDLTPQKVAITLMGVSHAGQCHAYCFVVINYFPCSPVDLRLDPEKIQRKLILVSLESKLFIE